MKKGIKTFILVMVILLANVLSAITVIRYAFNVHYCNNRTSMKVDYSGMEKQTFNSQFTVYEGNEISASHIKTLYSSVKASNEVYNEDDKYVEIRWHGELTGIRNLKSNKKYKVELNYNSQGYVCTVDIYEHGSNKNTDIYVVDPKKTSTYENEQTNTSVSVNEPIETFPNDEIEDTKGELSIDWEYGLRWIAIFAIIYAVIGGYAIYARRKYYNYKNGNMKKWNIRKTLIIILLILIGCITWFIALIIDRSIKIVEVAKPIIYIYPEEETNVTVKVEKAENLTCTYPIYDNSWEVLAKPDGTLIDEETGRKYYALYWEGINSKKYTNKLEEGFVVKGEDTVKFLEEKLSILGLNEREAEEFIVYWLPQMQNNKYNYIRFQTMDEINENMPLEISPKPETLIRVVMEWKELNKYIEVEEQELQQVERKGYTVVEWGGTKIK